LSVSPNPGRLATMPEEPNPNKIAAELFATLIKDAAKPVAAGVRDALTRTIDFFRLNVDQYITSSISRCSNVKTLLINRERPAPFFDLYVQTKLTCRDSIVLDDELIENLQNIKSLVIEGTGGAGKSMFMRYLYLCLCEKPGGKIPLFIELRHLNNVQKKDLFTFILYSIVNPGSTITEEQLERGLKAGSFTIILDGFDEIDFGQREQLAAQILDFRLKYPDLAIIVSSRPDPDARFESWSQFHVYCIRPMEEDQVRSLIGKLDYDVDAKKRFLAKLRELFRTHESFLSIPLLCIIMLITFDQSADIPDKKHIFFEHGFDALFFRHDASKQGAYKRKSYSSLPIDEFRNCLSAFCITTYTKEKFSFTLQEITGFLQKAFEFEGKDRAVVEPFLRDLLESVCVLQIEGVEYAFTHRSFQEYFAAYFISRSPDVDFGQLLDQFCRRREDTVVEMAFDMNRPLLERQWILPKLQQICERAEQLDLQRDLIGYAEQLFGGLGVYIGGSLRTQFYYPSEMTPNGHTWLAIKRLYPNHFADMHATVNRRLNKERVLISKKISEMKRSGDSRFGRKIGRTGFLLLNRTDNGWLLKTRIHQYLKDDRKLMRQLTTLVAQSVSQKAKGGVLFS
jgi:predicted NACHT family NTPase